MPSPKKPQHQVFETTATPVDATGMEVGELVTNTTDGKAFTKSPAGALVEVGGGGGVSDHGALTGTGDADSHPISAITGLQGELDGKSGTAHNHDGTYEPADAAIQSHLTDTANPHAVTAGQAGAEPAFAKNTAFNKNFGTLIGEVPQGNHNHDGAYDALGAASAVQGNLDTHEGASNPHTITPAGIGASPTGHQHTLSDVSDSGAMAAAADAASDGTPYSRQDAGWVPSPAGGSSAYTIRTFTGAMVFDENVSYAPYVQSGVLAITMGAAPVEGLRHLLRLDVTDAANITWGSEFKIIPNLVNGNRYYLEFVYSVADG